MVILFLLCFLIGLAGCLAVGIFHKVLKMPAALNLNETSFASDDHNNDHNFFNQSNNRHVEESRNEFDNKFNILNTSKSKSNRNQMAQAYFNNISVSYMWMPTNHCFPNDFLIPIENFHYIQLIQNSVIVICFATIFVLYALICVLVSKRRQLKTNRAKYYNEILFRSQKNGMINMDPSNDDSLITREKSGAYDETSFDKTRDKSYNQLSRSEDENCRSQENIKKKLDDDNVDLLKYPSKTFANKTNGLELQNNISNEKKLLNVSEIKNKATQTKSTAIAQMKKPDGNLKTKMKDSSEKNQNGHAQTKSEMNMSSSLLANLKTAFMLFVVTLIMMIVYTPALLTSLGYIKYNSIHWNLIYINNAINPIVYSFLNSNFRDNLRKTFNKFFNRIFLKNA